MSVARCSRDEFLWNLRLTRPHIRIEIISGWQSFQRGTSHEHAISEQDILRLFPLYNLETLVSPIHLIFGKACKRKICALCGTFCDENFSLPSITRRHTQSASKENLVFFPQPPRLQKWRENVCVGNFNWGNILWIRKFKIDETWSEENSWNIRRLQSCLHEINQNVTKIH